MFLNVFGLRLYPFAYNLRSALCKSPVARPASLSLQLRAALKTLERRLLQVRLTARHRTEEARLTTEPEFIAVEERMQRIAEQLRAWVGAGGRGAEGGDDESDGARA
jgi:hypothetical protein